MVDNPAIAIGLGMIISLILTEAVGVTAGGLIVPGYIALNLHSPYMVLITFLISILTLLILNFLSRFIIIYGNKLIPNNYKYICRFSIYLISIVKIRFEK